MIPLCHFLGLFLNFPKLETQSNSLLLAQDASVGAGPAGAQNSNTTVVSARHVHATARFT